MSKENMSKKIWDKGTKTSKAVEQFTVGRDRDFDRLLAPYDILSSLAHAIMLENCGLITGQESDALCNQLKKMYPVVRQHDFDLPDEVEDIHSWVELQLTESLGETGKKIHIGRSRNDLVLVDLKLYIRDRIQNISDQVKNLAALLLDLSEKHKNITMPGYTHMQVAMPSSFGLWFAAFAESLADDLLSLQAAYQVVNKNPLGSAAGYGSSFPIDREMTGRLLGFESLHYNSIYAQMNRGKTERVTSQAIANIAATTGKLAMDMILYTGQNFSFISFPDELTTGSSIMPHKKNPDVLEIIRGQCARLMAMPNEITMLTQNLPTGYHRDLQLLKEIFLPALTMLPECLAMMQLMLENIQVRKNILDEEMYGTIYSVEAVQVLTQSGMSFRDAYRQVAEEVKSGKISRPDNMEYTHQGSSGNLCNDRIRKILDQAVAGFNFAAYNSAIQRLLA